MAKANIPLTIDAELLREARILAAQEGTSVSRLLADRLEELVRRHRAYEAARRPRRGQAAKGLSPRVEAAPFTRRAP